MSPTPKDSNNTMTRTFGFEKPSVLSTATSVVRSRDAMAMVFTVMKKIDAITARPMALNRNSTLPSISRNER